MNRNITEPWTASVPADRQGEFFHRYILGVYELYRRLTRALPGHPVRVVRRRRRRGSTPGCSPTRRRRGRATTPTRSSGCAIQWGTSLAYPAVSSMARARLGGAQPPDGPRHAAVHPGRGRDVRGVRLRAGPDGDARRRAGRGRAPGRLVRASAASCSSAAGSCACAARSRATATRRRGWRSTTTASQRGRRVLPRARAAPARSASGSACAGSTRRRPTASRPGWTSFAAPVATADRAGDELMAVGLGIEPPDMAIPAQRVARRHPARARRLPGPPVRRRQALSPAADDLVRPIARALGCTVSERQPTRRGSPDHSWEDR